jgi:hypothetical protein
MFMKRGNVRAANRFLTIMMLLLYFHVMTVSLIIIPLSFKRWLTNIRLHLLRGRMHFWIVPTKLILYILFLFKSIDGFLIRKMALRTSGSAAPSGLDAATLRRLCNCFKDASKTLCNALASFARRLATEYLDPRLTEAFLCLSTRSSQ